MTLTFYIDKDHFPYNFKDNLSFENKALVEAIGPSSWLSWTLRTYLELKEFYNCSLTDAIPEKGIIFFFRGSMPLTDKPNRAQLWVCMVGDGTWHPYSHVNIFQNHSLISKFPQSYFLRHWPQLGIIKLTTKNAPLRSVYYFGDKPNLAPELQSADWSAFLDQNGYSFYVPDFSGWHDYSNADLVIGLRAFDSSDKFYNKPASKLINAWLAHTVFIGGEDSAFAYEQKSELDYICVDTYQNLKESLKRLRSESGLYEKYRAQSAECAKRYSDEFFIRQWTAVINDKILPFYKHNGKEPFLKYYRFLAQRFLLYRLNALMLRVKKLKIKSVNNHQ